MQHRIVGLALELGADSAGWVSLNEGELAEHSLLSEPEARQFRSTLVITRRHRASALKGLTGMPTKAYDRDYRRLNVELQGIVNSLESALTENGVVCRAVSPTETLDVTAQRGLISHKALAERAGLGIRGRNNLLVALPRFPAVRLCTLLTGLEVENSEPVTEEHPCSDCRNCIELCPAGAIGESWQEYRIDLCLEHLEKVAAPDLSYQICGACLVACTRRDIRTKTV